MNTWRTKRMNHKKPKKEKYSNFFEQSSKVMSLKRAQRADKRAREIIHFLKLSEARKKMGLRQVDIKGFTQAEISKIENRTDIKLSTLMEYLRSIGMGIKIIGIPKNREKEEFIILKSKAN